MNQFPSMHARDASRLPHASLEELIARVPRESALVQAFVRAKTYNPARGPAQERGLGRRGGQDKNTYMRERARKLMRERQIKKEHP